MVAPIERSLTEMVGFLPNQYQADVLAQENNHSAVMSAACKMTCKCCPLGEHEANRTPDGKHLPPVMNSISRLDGGQPIVFIGEGPGHHERLQNQCFVGKSGQLIKAMACRQDRVAIPHQWCYWTNLVRCRPADIIFDPNSGKGRKADRAPSKQEVDACYPLLLKTLACLPNMRYILLLGKHAAVHCLGLKTNFKVLDNIGYGLPLKVCGKRVTAVIMAHPSYLLRNSDDTTSMSKNFQVLQAVKQAVYTQAKEIPYTPIPVDMFVKSKRPMCYEQSQKV